MPCSASVMAMSGWGRAAVEINIHRGLKTLASLIGSERERALDKDG